MPTIDHAQYGFNAGELSPRMEMRDDAEARKLGMDYIENWLVHLQGPISTVPGFNHVDGFVSSIGKIFPFFVNTFTGFVVAVTPEKVYINDKNGHIHDTDYVENGDFLDGSTGWTSLGTGGASVTYSGGSALLSPSGSSRAGIRQNVDLTAIPTEDLVLIVEIASGSGPLRVQVGTTSGGTDIHPRTTYTGVSTIYVDLVGLSVDNIWVDIDVSADEDDKRIQKVAVFDDNSTDTIEFTSPWTDIGDIEEIQVDMAPGTFDLHMVSRRVAPQVLSYDRTTRAWSFGPKVFTNKPVEWTGTNWPGAICFDSGRLYLGGTPDQPETFWGSRSGENAGVWNKYEDFETGSEADHAIEYTIDRKGAIRWMKSSRNLVIGTAKAEHIVTSEGGVIIPGDIQVDVQSTYGSAIGAPVEVGNDIVFITPDRAKLRSMGYEWTKQVWSSKDLTFPAEHITKNNLLKEIHYAPNPYSLVFGPTNQNTAIMCAYDAENGNAGFFRRTTLGSIISMCTLQSGGVDEIWVLVDRDLGGVLCLEKTNANDTTKLDAYRAFSSETATSSWSGAGQVANKECQVIADGAVHPNITVAADGTFSTEYAVNEVVIGRQINSIGRTMSLGTTIQYQGTTRAMRKRWSKLYARIVNSLKPKINGRRPPTRLPSTLMGRGEEPITETIQVGNLGWDLDGRIEIEQDLPVYTEVAGVFGKLSLEEL